MPSQTTRILPDFIEAWESYTRSLPTDPLYKTWGGVFAISAALTRRVWTHGLASLGHLYPNLFVALIGEPGFGKDVAINPVVNLLEAACEGVEDGYKLLIGEETLSPKGLIDSINSPEAQQTLKHNGHIIHFNSLIGCVPELGTLIPEYDTKIISVINDLFNCRKHFKERTRGGIPINIPNPHLALFLGTQPDTFVEIFPERAFRMGFPARLIMVFAEKSHRVRIYDKDNADDGASLFAKLVSDLRTLLYLSGEFKMDTTTQDLLNDFHLVGCDKTALGGSRFKHWNTRRSLHLQKLMMIMSISESSDMVILPRHFERALELLFKTEDLMPKIFSDVVSNNGFQSMSEDILHVKLPNDQISMEQLVRQLRTKCRPNEIRQVIHSMLAAGDIGDAGFVNGRQVFNVLKGVH